MMCYEIDSLLDYSPTIVLPHNSNYSNYGM